MSYIGNAPSGPGNTGNILPVDVTGPNYNVQDADFGKILLVDASSGATTIILPALASVSVGTTLYIKKIDSSAFDVTLDGNAVDTINGSQTLSLGNQWDGVSLVRENDEWITFGSSFAGSTAGASNSFEGTVLVPGSKTFGLSDVNTIQRVTSGGTTYLTVPNNVTVPFAIGAEIHVFGEGTGVIGYDAPAGVIIGSQSGELGLDGQYTYSILRKIDTDLWSVTNADIFISPHAVSWVTNASLDDIEISTAVNLQLEAADTDPGHTLTYTEIGSNLATLGLTISSGGLITGTVPGTETLGNTFTIRADDGLGETADRTFSLDIVDPAVLVTVKMWGAGGGLSNYGGTGGFTYATLSGLSGQTLTVRVGGAGASSSGTFTTAPGGGFGGGYTPIKTFTGQAGSGGGRSSIEYNNVEIAGAGGGGGGNHASTPVAPNATTNGGHGGFPTGSSGGSTTRAPQGGSFVGGGGGTQSAGGTGGTNSDNPSRNGGAGVSHTNPYLNGRGGDGGGGGGGGGFYQGGGGAGAGNGPDNNGGAGGGGSSWGSTGNAYIDSVSFTSGTYGANAPEQGDPDYANDAGKAASPGRVVIDDGTTKTVFQHLGSQATETLQYFTIS